MFREIFQVSFPLFIDPLSCAYALTASRFLILPEVQTGVTFRVSCKRSLPEGPLPDSQTLRRSNPLPPPPILPVCPPPSRTCRQDLLIPLSFCPAFPLFSLQQAQVFTPTASRVLDKSSPIPSGSRLMHLRRCWPCPAANLPTLAGQ